ncbi:MAG: hypothetical protein GX638_07605, partial [Crenarchaeota archaeon]|nr:hypothetical protein [Thermoproteota archaeon]
MSECDEIQLLSQLGLTGRQAKVFVTLTKVKEESIQNIAANTKMDRANVYRTISELEKLGVVEKIIAVPALYKAISMRDIISTLLDNKQKEYLDIKEKTKEILKKHIESKEIKIKNKSQLTIIPKGKPIERKIHEL